MHSFGTVCGWGVAGAQLGLVAGAHTYGAWCVPRGYDCSENPLADLYREKPFAGLHRKTYSRELSRTEVEGRRDSIILHVDTVVRHAVGASARASHEGTRKGASHGYKPARHVFIAADHALSSSGFTFVFPPPVNSSSLHAGTPAPSASRPVLETMPPPFTMAGIRGHGPSEGKRGLPPLAHRGHCLPCRTSSTCSVYLRPRPPLLTLAAHAVRSTSG